MSSHRIGPRARWYSSARVRALLSLGVALGIGTTGTFAFWTDDVTVSGATFSSGTLDLKVNGEDTVTNYTALNFANALPGQSSAAVLTVRSNGSVPLKYTVAQTATNADNKNLRASLQVKVTAATTATGTFPNGKCDGNALPNFTTSFAGASFLSVGRQLGAATEEKLCVQVTLDQNAPNSLQGASTTVGLTFSATSDLS